MTKKEMFVKAHKIAREIKKEYPEVDYKFQFGLCLAYLQEGEEKMVELKGSEKQIKWAKDIKPELIKNVKEYKEDFNSADIFKINYLNTFKKEIFKRASGSKISKEEAIKILNSILDEAISNIENETSAKKLIEVKTSFRLADATIDKYLIKEFI